MKRKFEVIATCLEQQLGKKRTAALMDGVEIVFGGNPEHSARWISSFITKLKQESEVDLDRLLGAYCPCQMDERTIEQAKAILDSSATTGQFVREMKRQNVIGRDIRYEAGENAIYITKRYACEAGGGSDQTNLVAQRCHCDLVNATTEPIPSNYCHCAARFYYPLFSSLFGKQVYIEPVKTVLSGDDECVFAVRIDGRPWSREERIAALVDERYPLAARYDPSWILENEMGSQCLWLAEGVTRKMELRPGMRILDMGCGKALTSIFLAREFGMQVFANDFWIPASENWKRISAAGMGHLVCPITGEAHSLPYAEGFFDAIVCVNSYQFYGTADTYFNEYFVNLVKPGGQIVLAVPGLHEEFGDELPPHMQESGFSLFYFHSPQWWRRHFQRCGTVDIELIDEFDGEGSDLMLKWEPIVDRTHGARIDRGRNLAWVRIVLRRKS